MSRSPPTSLGEKPIHAAVNAELERIWTRVQAELAGAVDEPTYRIWLEPLRARSLEDDRLIVEAPAQARGWIRDRFGGVLATSARAVLGPDVLLEIVGPTRVGPIARPDLAGGPHARAWASGDPPCGQDGDLFAGPLGNPKLTFEQFVIGDCNRLAHAAALTVAEMPAQAYNPLFICGPPGVGKTHLLSSIASLLLAHSPGLTVRCTTGEAFTNEFLAALGGGRTEWFKARFRHVDILLLDDVQFLERKTKTEEEFFHTFNALHDGGRQIVLTSDRAPQNLQALEDRLRERFAAGLVADIAPPDVTTRLAILRKRAHHDNVDLDDDHALQVIAERVCKDVRALEGALIRIVAFSSLTGRPFTSELAREVLDRLYPCTEAREADGCRTGCPDTAAGVRALRPIPRRAPLIRAHLPYRLATPGGDVSRPRAHRASRYPRSAGTLAGAIIRPSFTRADERPCASQTTPTHERLWTACVVRLATNVDDEFGPLHRYA